MNKNMVEACKPNVSVWALEFAVGMGVGGRPTMHARATKVQGSGAPCRTGSGQFATGSLLFQNDHCPRAAIKCANRLSPLMVLTVVR